MTDITITQRTVRQWRDSDGALFDVTAVHGDGAPAAVELEDWEMTPEAARAVAAMLVAAADECEGSHEAPARDEPAQLSTDLARSASIALDALGAEVMGCSPDAARKVRKVLCEGSALRATKALKDDRPGLSVDAASVFVQRYADALEAL